MIKVNSSWPLIRKNMVKFKVIFCFSLPKSESREHIQEKLLLKYVFWQIAKKHFKTAYLLAFSYMDFESLTIYCMKFLSRMEDLCVMVSNSFGTVFSRSTVCWEVRTTAMEIKFHFLQIKANWQQEHYFLNLQLNLLIAQQ